MLARDYFQYQSKDYYEASENQYTIHLFSFCPYENILNYCGLELLVIIHDKLHKNQIQGVIENYELRNVQSGKWLRKPTHPLSKHCNKVDRPLTMHNRIVVGMLHNNEIRTSCVRMYNEQEKWVCTINEHVYRLGQKRSRGSKVL